MLAGVLAGVVGVSGGGGCVGGTRGSCFNDVWANMLTFDQKEASRRGSGDPDRQIACVRPHFD